MSNCNIGILSLMLQENCFVSEFKPLYRLHVFEILTKIVLFKEFEQISYFKCNLLCVSVPIHLLKSNRIYKYIMAFSDFKHKIIVALHLFKLFK